ncbi:UNVERIFIED_CONTAM: putative cadmium/zinc-transporting ATPase HMA4 [Sesamum calycinum]|uniref:Cadmium/zinc-transporting ATPase HMA4 n=1 Tax=Sesamum calycinum TaxID=2727403 RepID=A0AAW2NTH8_9LAMI
METIDKNVGKKFQKSYFDVLGLCCSSEIPMIERILSSLDGVKDFSVIVPTKTVIVVHDSLLISQIQIVSGSIALHDYWEAATIVFLFTIAEWLESRASHKATAVMSSLVNVVPQRAVLADTGEEINADEVKLNTVLAVKAGEVIPIDGVVVEGNCEVDEKFLTGESFPVAKQKDSIVWASTINLNAIVVISAFLAIVPVVFKVENKKEWYHLSLVVLVSGCPCALLLSTPVAMFCALSKAARLGVLFKGAEHLETLARIKITAFDKTGTITRGEFLVADFKSLQDNVSLNTLLYWISSIESKSSHPMAAALVDFARAQGIEPKPEKVEKFQIFPGEGIFGRIEDNDVYVGNWKVASRAGGSTVPNLEGYDVEGKSVGYVFLGPSPAGIFCLSDACRTGAKEALKELKSIGIKTVMLTGDSCTAAKHAQAQLGGALEVVHAELLPEDKERIIKELQKEGPTAMIGDGVNDAPALATADIGISMGVSGSALATETGDIVLMSNDIQRIPKALRIAKKVRRKIIENVIIAISTKAAILGLAIAGHPLVWAAVLTDVGTCLLVIFNSMLLLQGISTQRKQCCRSTTNSHVHKQKCRSTSGCSSHTDNSSCFDVESQKKCQPQTCSSKTCSSDSTSCGKKKCSNAAKGHGCDAHSHHHNDAHSHHHDEAKAMDHHDLRSERIHCHQYNKAKAMDDQNLESHTHTAMVVLRRRAAVMHNNHCMENHCAKHDDELNGRTLHGCRNSLRRECCKGNGKKEGFGPKVQASVGIYLQTCLPTGNFSTSLS